MYNYAQRIFDRNFDNVFVMDYGREMNETLMAGDVSPRSFIKSIYSTTDFYRYWGLIDKFYKSLA